MAEEKSHFGNRGILLAMHSFFKGGVHPVPGTTLLERPFKHLAAPDFVAPELSKEILNWLACSDAWQRAVIPDFYQLYNMRLTDISLPRSLSFLTEVGFIRVLSEWLSRSFGITFEDRVEVTAHKLGVDDFIKVHTDFGAGPTTHRLLFQFNSGWTPERGGFLLLFDNDPSDAAANAKLVAPLTGSAFAFEVSDRSFHAVSPVLADERFTISYAFVKNRGMKTVAGS